MARLIDADGLLEELSKSTIITDDLYGMGIMAGNDHAMNKIKNAPTIDAEPVRHGRWEWITEDVYRCVNCGERVRVKEVMGKPDWVFCPNCIAKMDGGAERWLTGAGLWRLFSLGNGR